MRPARLGIWRISCRSGRARIGRKEPRQPHAPGRRLGFVADQILADLDQHVGEAAPGRVGVHRVARQGAIIRLVVADQRAAGCRSGSRRERPQRAAARGAGRRPTAGPTCQGRASPFIDGVKECIDTMAGTTPVASMASSVASMRVAVGLPVASIRRCDLVRRRCAHCRARWRRPTRASPASDRRRRGWGRSAAANRWSAAPGRRRIGRHACGSRSRRRCHRRCGARTRPRRRPSRRSGAGSAFEAWSQSSSTPPSSRPGHRTTTARPRHRRLIARGHRGRDRHAAKVVTCAGEVP